mmetsp:Transcript_57521/g.175180  ORF Transcript_57521/g.175180 Transcript_57521/m.175180 type:complete len:269 (+) Transcript_57521:299-1105(+)
MRYTATPVPQKRNSQGHLPLLAALKVTWLRGGALAQAESQANRRCGMRSARRPRNADRRATFRCVPLPRPPRPAVPDAHQFASMVFKGLATLNSNPVASRTASTVVSGAISTSVGGASGPVVTKSKTPSSVMQRLTTRAPVSGKPQLCFNLCLPPLARCSITTSTRESDDTRSMAPPMPLTILPGMIQFAKSPFAATSMAPRMVTSTWEPRIIAKESDEEKLAEPGMVVMVSFPALIRSGSTSASVGYGPMPNNPFSLCNSMRTPGFV